MFEEIIPLYEMIKEKKTSPIYPQLQEEEKTLVIITDASHIGWGGIVCNPKEKEVKVHASRWPKIGGEVDPLYESSVIAEPQAIKEVLLAHEIPDYITHVTIVTDHSPIVSAAKSYQARSYNYFKLLEWLEKQRFSYNVLFIPGEINIATSHHETPTTSSSTKVKHGKSARLRGWGMPGRY